MNLFIPELGTKLLLTKLHTFDVKFESRNESLFERENPEIFQKLKEKESEKQWESDNCWIEHATYRNWFATTKYKELEAEQRSIMEAMQSLPNRFSFPKGTILEIDRIYIRKGSQDYSSITFKWRTEGRVIRFWLKLDVCNTIECEVLDVNDFDAKYPHGKFTLQRYYGHGIYWCNKVTPSNRRPRGIGVSLGDGFNGNGSQTVIKRLNYQNNSFGKVAHYDSLKKMISSAQKLGFPSELVTSFVAEYSEI